MKRVDDPRHKKRINLVKNLFAASFAQQPDMPGEVEKILKNQEKIDKLITQAAPEWPISQINRVDVGILRLAIYELLKTKVPKKVIIDEAVELAKEFGSESSPKFINGVLGTIVNKLDNKKD